MSRPIDGYRLADGTPVIGTTSVCDLLAKPFLVGWASKLALAGGYEAGRSGLPIPRKWQEVVYPPRDRAAEAGTLIHDAFEIYLRGEHVGDDFFPDTRVGQMGRQGYRNALNWIAQSSMQIIPFERPLVSETLRFGGTPDALMVERGDILALGDWKGGGIWPEMLSQMAAYRQLLREVEGVETRGVHLVRFHRDYGDFHHHYFGNDALDDGWEVFRHLLAVVDPLERVRARVR